MKMTSDSAFNVARTLAEQVKMKHWKNKYGKFEYLRCYYTVNQR